ncbi:putative RNA polymerase II nuclear localization protein SLC7A6OS [Gastrophryne carolinensis]
MEAAAVLRVKRKRGADPAEALLISCKRLRSEQEKEAAAGGAPEQQLFRLAATVTSQDEPIQKYVHEAMSRDRAALALNPSLGSLQRIQKDLKACKETERQESRYRVISSLRPNCDEHDEGADKSQPTSPATDPQPVPPAPGTPVDEEKGAQIANGSSFQVFDMVHEEQEASFKNCKPETIMCNSVAMIRERLVLSDSGLGSEHRENQDEFVYDIYYAESSPHNWIQDILSVKPYLYEQELMNEDPEPEEIYDDEDDENEETNWRNDYPDEGDENDSDREEIYTGYYEDSDGESRGRGNSWTAYRQRMLQEMEYDEEDD